jgi:hypothetical protein
MRVQVARHFIIPPAGVLLGCILLFLWSGLPITPALACCGNSMGFPFSCLLILLTIFSIGAYVPLFARKSEALFSGRAARLQQLATLILSTEIRAGFVLSLFLSSPLIIFGAALTFSLSFGFNWSALVLGCLSILLGLGILLLGLRQTRYPRPR